MNRTLGRLIINSLCLTRLHRFASPLTAGLGVIFTLHRVRPARTEQSGFAPNDVIEITPEFLDQTIQCVKASGYDLVGLDEVLERTRSGTSQRRFACFTLDDGYKDTFEYAMPVFEQHRCPYTVYVTTGFIDRLANPWWMVLEKIIAENDVVHLPIGDSVEDYVSASIEEKNAAFGKIYWRIRRMPADEIFAVSANLATRYQVEWSNLCEREFMNWDMIRALTQSGLCTLGAHTVMHHPVSRMTESALVSDIEQCQGRISDMTGDQPSHFAYPFGDPTSVGERDFSLLGKLGFESSCTTQNGVMMRHHRHALHALPRVPLHGGYQSVNYVEFVLSGLPFARETLNAYRAARVSATNH